MASGNRWLGISIRQLVVSTFYFSPNAPVVMVELVLATLKPQVSMWKGPLIVFDDFNAKARAWRGDIIGEIMAAYNLVGANQPEVYFYKRGVSRSV